MKWLRVPDPLTLLVACVVSLPASATRCRLASINVRRIRRTGSNVVVAGTYAPVEPRPVGLFDAMVAIPRGMANAADVVFLILFGSAAFTVVDRTGALATGVSWLVAKLGRPQLLSSRDQPALRDRRRDREHAGRDHRAHDHPRWLTSRLGSRRSSRSR